MDEEIDIMVITESWVRKNEEKYFNFFSTQLIFIYEKFKFEVR